MFKNYMRKLSENSDERNLKIRQMERSLMLVNKNFQYCQDASSFQLDVEIHFNPYQNSTKLLCKYRQLYSKIYMYR